MALNFILALHCPKPHSSSCSSFFLQNKAHVLKFHCSRTHSSRKLAVSEGAEGRVGEEEAPVTSSSSGSSSSARTQLDLLEQLTSGSQLIDGYESDGSSQKITIRDQLTQLIGDRDDDFSLALGKKNLKKVSARFLTISQKRNIKRQAYLNEVAQRNDSVFFATIGAFVILPPLVILGIAILTGYVQLFP